MRRLIPIEITEPDWATLRGVLVDDQKIPGVETLAGQVRFVRQYDIMVDKWRYALIVELAE